MIKKKRLGNGLIIVLLVLPFFFACSTAQKYMKTPKVQQKETTNTEKQRCQKDSQEIQIIQKKGIVINIKEFLPVRADVGRESESVGNLYINDKVNMCQEQDGWIHITQYDETGTIKIQGWVIGKFIERLPDEVIIEPADAQMSNKGFVINVENDLAVKNEASKDAEIVGRLYLGDKVTIKKAQCDALYITTTSENDNRQVEGWVLGENIDRLLKTEKDAGSLIALAYMRGPDHFKEKEAEIEKMKKKVKIQGTLAGAGIGAGAAFLHGKKKDKSNKDIAKDALKAGAIGGVVGYAAGSFVADKMEDAARMDIHLENCIQEAQEYEKAALGQISKLNNTIAATKQEIDMIENKIQETDLKQQKTEKQKAALENILTETNKRIGILNDLIASQEKLFQNISQDTEGYHNLKNEKENIQEKVHVLEKQRDWLVEHMGSSKMG